MAQATLKDQLAMEFRESLEPRANTLAEKVKQEMFAAARRHETFSETDASGFEDDVRQVATAKLQKLHPELCFAHLIGKRIRASGWKD